MTKNTNIRPNLSLFQNSCGTNLLGIKHIYNNQAYYNLEQISSLYITSIKFLEELALHHGKLLTVFSGLDISLKSELSSTIIFDWPSFYVLRRWLGGMLTNWPTIVEYRNRMMSSTLNIRHQKHFSLLYEGFSTMQVLPDALFILNATTNKIAIKEATSLGIPVIAVVDTNYTNIHEIAYPLPCNLHDKLLVTTLCKKIKSVLLQHSIAA